MDDNLYTYRQYILEFIIFLWQTKKTSQLELQHVLTKSVDSFGLVFKGDDPRQLVQVYAPEDAHDTSTTGLTASPAGGQAHRQPRAPAALEDRRIASPMRL